MNPRFQNRDLTQLPQNARRYLLCVVEYQFDTISVAAPSGVLFTKTLLASSAPTFVGHAITSHSNADRAGKYIHPFPCLSCVLSNPGLWDPSAPIPSSHVILAPTRSSE